ncbi:type IIL restriction-modification enzyme MmeI [Glutamicibacter nicotianae]|uniref:type IIL restriction-modification enzyme MmeI n=1 Tax=Glutamicibacter nicotianae TaxID=37929 RepID=UPI0032D95C4B
MHPERSLAEHYNPLAMAPELVKAHDALDREVDKAMGGRRASSLRSVSARSCCLPITRNSPTINPTLVRTCRAHVLGCGPWSRT